MKHYLRTTLPTAKLTESFNGIDLADGTAVMYTEEALRKAYKEIVATFAALGANLDDFPTIEEFRIAYEEELRENPPYDDEDIDEDEGDSKPRHH